MKPLRVKILGSGGAAKKHAQAFQELGDLYRVVDSEDCDIVDICTPPYLHYDQICAKLPSAHAIVEKPICGSLAEIDMLARIERRGTKRICPVFQYRFTNHDPLTPPFLVSNWTRPPSYYSGWRGDWSKALGGCLTSHGIHIIDLINTNIGQPKQVKAALTFGPTVEQIAHVDFPGEPVAFDVAVGSNIREPNFFHLGDSHAGYVNQFRLLHEALTLDKPLPVTLEEARQSLEVLTACYYSAAMREPVTLPLKPSHPAYQGWQQHFQQRQQHRESSQRISV